MEPRCVLQFHLHGTDSATKLPPMQLIVDNCLTVEQLLAAITAGDVDGLELQLYSKFYDPFCTLHGVDIAARKPFKKLGPESMLKRSKILLNKTIVCFFIHQCLHWLDKSSKSEYLRGSIQEVDTLHMLIVWLWPHTFATPDSKFDEDGIYRPTVMESFQSVMQPLPHGVAERKRQSLSSRNVSNKELADQFTSFNTEVKKHKEQRLLELRAILQHSFSDLKQASNPFVDEQFCETRRVIDVAIMELVRDKQVEICPCCYLGFKDRASNYLQLFGSERKEKKNWKVCGSHIFSEHYLEQIRALVGADVRHEAVLLTSASSMKIDMLCNFCDNKQGVWEHLIAQKENCCARGRCNPNPHYSEPAFMQWGDLNRDAHLPSNDNFMRYKSQRSLFRFYVPCIYRSLLLDVDTHTDSDYSWQITDTLREYMHRHLYGSELVNNDLPSIFIYAMGVYSGNMPQLCQRLMITQIPSEKIAVLLHASCYSTTVSFDGSLAVGAIVAPYVLCISKVQHHALSAFQIRDCSSPLTLPFPDESCSSACNFMALVYSSYYRSSQLVFFSDKKGKIVEDILATTRGQLSQSPIVQFLMRASAAISYLSPDKCTGVLVPHWKKGFEMVNESEHELVSGRTVTLLRDADSPELRKSIERFLQVGDAETQKTVEQELTTIFACVDEVYQMFTVLFLCALKLRAE